MTHNDTKLLGTVHGGVIMKLVDDAAGAVAGRHSGGPAVTASMDEMAFFEPVRVGDLVHVKAQVNWTGRTSMEVGRAGAGRTLERVHAGHARRLAPTSSFAAVDADGKPRRVAAGPPRDRPRPPPLPGGPDPPHPPPVPPPRDPGTADTRSVFFSSTDICFFGWTFSDLLSW
ncbi:hypothetical protein STENM223S_07498 [Streptomyces tendae]